MRKRSRLDGVPTQLGIEQAPDGSQLGEPTAGAGLSVVVIGCGGNIGSHLVPHLGRMPLIRQVTLIDRDVYEAKNLTSQDITAADVGQPKAIVQARRLRRINPALRVMAITEAVETVPLGHLRADIVLTGLDSRQARQWVNECIWRLGIPWIDAGVEPGGLLARITTYQPGPDAPCLECLFDDRTYALLAQAYPCSGGGGEAASTNAPSSLGALAAALQAIECRKLIEERLDQTAIGHELVIDVAYHHHFLTKLRRKPECRFDHEVWRVIPAPRADLTLRGAIGLADSESGARPRLRVAGRLFALDSRCSCGPQAPRLVSAVRALCDRCGGLLATSGGELLSDIDVASLPAALQRRSLREIGVRSGDIFTLIAPTGHQHFEVM